MPERPFIFREKVSSEEPLLKAKELCPVTVFDAIDTPNGNQIVKVARPEDCINCKACESPCENEEIRVFDPETEQA